MMIQCQSCSAYYKYGDATCWHCGASQESHPARNDLRYRFANSWFAKLLLILPALAAVFYLIVGLLKFVMGNGEGLVEAVASLFVLIIALRLLL